MNLSIGPAEPGPRRPSGQEILLSIPAQEGAISIMEKTVPERLCPVGK